MIPKDQGWPYSARALAARIEHSVLAPEAGQADVESGCTVARARGVRSVVVKPVHVALARRLLEGTGIRVVSVIGFPHGNSTPEVKALEVSAAIRDGADEVDVVVNVGALCEGRWEPVAEELRAVVAASGGSPVKVILETALLTDAVKVRACGLADASGAAYVKTSTGFGRAGATVADVALLRGNVGSGVGVKASGGIRTLADAAAMIAAGADLIGTSQTEAILDEAGSAA
ncbi:MAG: deoxyribose-phosphate aldolase [Armatimonadetes bacterium]|nr:deoxyribose-phosphate aldolase [Armatimonadota bacterium]